MARSPKQLSLPLRKNPRTRFWSSRPSDLSLEDYLWSRVEKGAGCWDWTGCVDARGYGAFTYRQKVYKAHRVAWEVTHGPITSEQLVCHHCDNPRCCRPDHLFIGDHLANVQDAWRKGRLHRASIPPAKPDDFRSRAGERNGRATITDDMVRLIRQRYAEGGISQVRLAAELGVARHIISNIVSGRTWRHVK